MRLLTTTMALIAIAAIAIPAASAAPSAQRGGGPTVKVGDDFFSPSNERIKKGGQIKFKWLSSNKNKHNVSLIKGPGGINRGKFMSKTDKTGVRFSPKFAKAGKYQFFCSVHPDDMKIKVIVRR